MKYTPESYYYLNKLKDELARRCEINPRYSLRRFATVLDIDAGALSNIVSKKRVLSYKMGLKIVRQLNFSPEEESLFMHSVIEHQKLKNLKKVDSRFKNFSATKDIKTVDAEIFRIMGDWYHYAILELTYVKEFSSNPHWIAKKLNISPVLAKMAIERLLLLGLLKRENDKLVKSNKYITTKDKSVTTPALKKLQGQVLDMAKSSLENDPIAVRSMSSLCMPIDPEKIPLAKNMIEEFSQKLCTFLSCGEQKVVYQMGISLYPIQKQE